MSQATCLIMIHKMSLMTPPFEKNQGNTIVFNSLRMENLGRLSQSNIGLSTFFYWHSEYYFILNYIYSLLWFEMKSRNVFRKNK